MKSGFIPAITALFGQTLLLSLALAAPGDQRGASQQGVGSAGGTSASGIPASQIFVPAPQNQGVPSNLQQGTPQFQLPEGAPQPGQQQPQGKYTNRDGTVRLDEKLRDVLVNSVVEVTAYDQADAPIRKTMGVAIGKDAAGAMVSDRNFIAVPLSVVMGNNLQWADRLSITHHKGSSYNASIAMIDEELGLAILQPDNEPQPIRFMPAKNERNQIKVVMIKFNRNQKNEIVADVYWGEISALNRKKGTLIVSGDEVDSTMAGTGIINMKGELVGMLGYGGHGILSSAMYERTKYTRKKPAIQPKMVGVLMGKGVVVDKKMKGAYRSVGEALKEIRAGRAPKADPSLYIPKQTDETEQGRVIVKIHAGTFVEKSTLDLPANISITGAGPAQTILTSEDPAKPVISINDKKDISLANLMIRPAPLQKNNVNTVDIKDSSNVFILGNAIVSRGGSALSFQGARASAAFANAFDGKDANGSAKAVYCNNSIILAMSNAFIGQWGHGLSVGTECVMKASRNFFQKSKIGIAIASSSANVEVEKNTFIQTVVGVRYYGNFPAGKFVDNLFYRNVYSIYTSQKPQAEQFRYNSSWRSVATFKKSTIKNSGMMKSEPKFRNPATLDFRLKAGSAQFGAGSTTEKGLPTDIGAFQNADFLGKYSIQLANALGAIRGDANLAKTWGLVTE